MTDKPAPSVLKPVHAQFRDARLLFYRIVLSEFAPDFAFVHRPSSVVRPSGAGEVDSATSYAQVARMVAPCAGGLKPGDENGPNPGNVKQKNNDPESERKQKSDPKSRHAPKEEKVGKERNKPTPRTRPHPLGVRFSATELEIVKAKARAAGCSVNSYIRASTLRSDYKPPRDPELTEFMRLYYREYRMQGNNANQIARYCNMGAISPAEAMSGFEAYRQETARIMRAVLQKLANGDPEP